MSCEVTKWSVRCESKPPPSARIGALSWCDKAFVSPRVCNIRTEFAPSLEDGEIQLLASCVSVAEPIHIYFHLSLGAVYSLPKIRSKHQAGKGPARVGSCIVRWKITKSSERFRRFHPERSSSDS